MPKHVFVRTYTTVYVEQIFAIDIHKVMYLVGYTELLYQSGTHCELVFRVRAAVEQHQGLTLRTSLDVLISYSATFLPKSGAVSSDIS